MKIKLTFLCPIIIVSLFTGLNFAQQRPGVGYPAFENLDKVTQSINSYQHFTEMLTGDVFQDGADRLSTVQYTDGAWGWPVVAPPTYGNTVGPIGTGLAKAYYFTKDIDHLNALSNSGGYLLNKTNNFSPFDGYLAAALDQIFGGTTYRQHVMNNFYNPLAAGTYNRNGAGTLYSTMSYVNLIRTSRTGANANLAAWDLGLGLVAASMCGGGTADWITGVKGEIDELNGAGYYDVIGLAGALYGLAFVDEEFDPSAGQHAAAANLTDLANILASYQINLGGFAWNSGYVVPNAGNETIQETAYAILALSEVNRQLFLSNITGAGNYLIGTQLATGGWENYTGEGENNEITAEALWGISMSGRIKNITAQTYSLNIQQGITSANPADVILVPDGVYTENISINKNIKLVSVNGSAFTTISGIAGAGKNAAITVMAPTTDVQIGDINQGFKIIGIDNGTPGIESAALYFVGGPHTNAVIKNNEIVAAGDVGLLCDYNAVVTNFIIDGNIFSGQTFVGSNPAGDGFSSQFTLPNVPRQLVVMGGGSTGTNTQNITFSNNQITGIAGGISTTGNTGLPISPVEQGNNLVTIDADNSTITGNTFSGTTTRYATSLRCRRPGLLLSGNNFISTGLTPTTGHLYIQNNLLNPAIISANSFDAGSYILSGNQVNIVDGFTTASISPVGSVVYGINGELYVAGLLKIQHAVAAAVSGNKINVASGTYSSDGSTLTIDKPLTIMGVDKATTFIDVSTNGSAWGIRLGADNITLKNFTIIPAYIAGGAHEGFPVHASSNTTPLQVINNITVEDIIVNGSDRTGLDFHGITGLNISNVTSTNAQYGNGIQFSGCWNVTMSNITTSGNAWGGIAVYCSNPVYNLNRDKYSNNISFDFNTSNVAEWFYVEDQFGLVNTNIAVSNWTHKMNNNYLPGNSNYTAYTNKTLTDAINFAAGLNVKFANVKSIVLNTAGEYFVGNGMSIQSALDDAVNGNTINVLAGTYSSGGTTLTINKSISIIGADKTTTFIDVSSNGSAWGIRLGADNITLKNFTVIPAYIAGGAHEGFPVHASSNTSPLQVINNITVEDIIVNGSDRTGLDFHGITGLNISNVTSTNAQYGNGIQFSGCWNVTMNNITTSGNAWGGIAVYCSNPAYNLNRDKYSNNIAFDFNTSNVAEWFYVEDEFGLVNTNISAANYTYKINNNYNPGTANYTAYTNKTLPEAITFASMLNTKFLNMKAFILDPAGEFFVGSGMSIQSSIDNALNGNKINILSGTFNEAVNVNKIVEIVGAGSGTDGTIITNAAGTALVLGAGSSTESINRVIAKNLRLTGSVTGLNVSSYNTVDNVVSISNTTYGVALNNLTDLIITNCKFNQNSAGLKIASTVSADNITISNSEFNGNLQHGWYGDANSTTEPVFDNITVTSTTFNDNVNKGIYLERLSNAVFNGLTISNSGTGGALNHRAGIDLNLKWRTDYTNITITNSTILGCGTGDNNGAGLMIKARSDGGTYGANPAVLTNVYLSNLDVINCGGGTYSAGIRIGEANNSLTGTNTSPANVIISNCSFLNNNPFTVSNVLAGVQVNAEYNWWDTIVETEIQAQINGDVDYDPWLGHIAPSAPDNLTSTGDSSIVTLLWNDNSFNESGFKIERKEGDSLSSSTWILIDSVLSGVNTYLNTGLPQSTTFTYRVYSYNSMGNSLYSNVSQVTTLPIPPATFQMFTAIGNGWNIVSIPGLHPVNQNVDTWWMSRDQSAEVFKFNNNYQVVTQAEPGKGYWMKHLGARIYNTGDEWPSGGLFYVPYIPLTVNEGWNLIGGYDYLAATAGITSTPAGLINGFIFGYSTLGGYQPADNLVPGLGYWVKINAGGELNLPLPDAVNTAKTPEYIQSDWGKIIITDNDSRSYTLYAADENLNTNNYSLPPVPPDGMFDIRFSSGNFVENLNDQVQPVELSGVIYPVKIKSENIDLMIQDESGNTCLRIKAGEEIIISEQISNKILLSKDLLPDEFSLEQNYPNPFNPFTTIKFSLPDESNVRLTIYNVVGQKVAEIVNTRLEAGNYSYIWDAGNVSSGLYIYEINAEYTTGNFVSTKKMMVLK